VTLKKAANATKYQIRYSTKRSMKGAKTVTTTKTVKTIRRLKKGKKYYFQARSLKGSKKTSWSAKRAARIK
ncbi:MAG: hypothetical protein ACI4LM_00200, partial [Anaerovoracaceae bacterium]